jgi:hypothetical protein
MAKARLPWILLVIVCAAWAWQSMSGSFSPLERRVVTTADARDLREAVKNDTTMSDAQKRI